MLTRTLTVAAVVALAVLATAVNATPLEKRTCTTSYQCCFAEEEDRCSDLLGERPNAGQYARYNQCINGAKQRCSAYP